MPASSTTNGKGKARADDTVVKDGPVASSSILGDHAAEDGVQETNKEEDDEEEALESGEEQEQAVKLYFSTSMRRKDLY